MNQQRIVLGRLGFGRVVWGSGRQIAFDSDGGVFVIDSSGKHLRTLLGAHVSDTSPKWSPDGSQIAFVRKGVELGRSRFLRRWSVDQRDANTEPEDIEG